MTFSQAQTSAASMPHPPFAMPLQAPPITLLGAEPLRAALEYASMRLMNRDELPQGDGHPVVIFPGLASDPHALKPLRHCCERLGYAVYDWEQGFNTGPQGDLDEWLDNLAQHVKGVARLHRRRVSLIGWSLGGIYAREIAKLQPALSRRVVTLGTPFAGRGSETHVGWLYRLLNGSAPLVNDELALRLRSRPPVPTTSIYSRSDGIVAWQSCVMDSAAEGDDEPDNVEVDGSHIGLGWNPEVLRVVAQRLSQPEQQAGRAPL
jgi:pimeloyl-ACP methyl ester carboxylesterase